MRTSVVEHTGISAILKKEIDIKTRITWYTVFFILFFTYMLLVYVPFPDYKQGAEIELGEEFFEMFEPPPPPTPRSDIPETEVDALKDFQSLSAAEIAEAFNFEDMQEMDISGDILQEMEVFDEDAGGGGLDELMEDLDDFLAGTGAMGTDDFLTGDDESTDFFEGIAGLKTEGETVGITGADGTRLTSPGSGGGAGGGRGGGVGPGVGPGKKVRRGGGVPVTLKSYGEGDYRGREIINPLIEWMKKHPVQHPYTIREFLEYESGDLTSVVDFTIKDRSFEMYLRCTENTRELAICIVEGTDVIKLVDQGISERSHNLEIGNITRSGETGEIVGAFSTRTSPTRKETDEFMNIFLSWWNRGNPIE